MPRATTWATEDMMDRCNDVADAIASLLGVAPAAIKTAGSRTITLTVEQAEALVALTEIQPILNLSGE